METLDASGAVVCGMSEAVGVHDVRDSFDVVGAALAPLEFLAASLDGLALCDESDCFRTPRTRVVVVFRVVYS